MRSNNHKSNYNHVKRIIRENETLLAPMMTRCPAFLMIISHILEDKFGFRVRSVSYTSEMTDWEEEETMVSSLHNLSRSTGVALLAASDDSSWVSFFVGGEICLYFLFKILRRDFFYWMPFKSFGQYFFSFVIRIGVKIIVDFR